MAKEISAGIIIYRNTKQGPLFLLLYHGGKYWALPKGHIEMKENSRRAALREVREETGLSIKNLKFHPKFRTQDTYIFTRNKKRVFKIVRYFLAESNKSFVKISPREHRGYGWFNYKEAENILPYKNLKKLLKNAYDTIREENSKNSK